MCPAFPHIAPLFRQFRPLGLGLSHGSLTRAFSPRSLPHTRCGLALCSIEHICVCSSSATRCAPYAIASAAGYASDGTQATLRPSLVPELVLLPEQHQVAHSMKSKARKAHLVMNMSRPRPMPLLPEPLELAREQR